MGQMSELYRDESYAPLWARFLLGGFGVATAASLGYQLITGIGLGSKPAPNSVLFVLMLLFFVIYHTFHKLTISINIHKVDLMYGFLKKTVYVPNIKSVELDNVGFIQYGGLGLKYNLKGELAYSTRTGEAVKINRRNGKPILFTPNTPGEAIGVIERIIQQ